MKKSKTKAKVKAKAKKIEPKSQKNPYKTKKDNYGFDPNTPV